MGEDSGIFLNPGDFLEISWTPSSSFTLELFSLMYCSWQIALFVALQFTHFIFMYTKHHILSGVLIAGGLV